ncbi:MAG: hypothetical protein KDD45_06200, partial [Bdellovibrionales bacterium]|nr:hypothetical protein [Bdellovibrionales bacterium]
KITLILLSIASVLVISCSRGGSDSSTPANNNGQDKTQTQKEKEFPNKVGTALGAWVSSDATLKLYISENKARLEAFCKSKTTVLEFGVQVAGNKISFLESKKAGDTDCPIEVKKGEEITYAVSGNQLILSTPGEKDLVMTRIENQQTPQEPVATPDNPQQPDAGNSNSLEMYTDVGCTGQKVVYTEKMNCQTVSNTLAILSVKAQDQCQNLQQTLSAQQICQAINQQLGN